MKFLAIVLLVTCLSCCLTPAKSTALIADKIALGVKGATLFGSGALAVKGKVLKGMEKLLSAKSAAIQNAGTIIANALQKHSVTVAMEQSNDVTNEEIKPSVPAPVETIEVHPVNTLMNEDRPIEIQSLHLVPIETIPTSMLATGARHLKGRPLKIWPIDLSPTKTLAIKTNIIDLKKKMMLGLFKKIHGIITSKKNIVAGLTQAVKC